MWKVLVILNAWFAVGLGAISYGPCHNVSTVDLDINKWEGQYFVNVMTNNPGLRCMWVDRKLEWAGERPANPTKENTLIGEIFKRIDNGASVTSTVQGTYVGNGHYQIHSATSTGTTVIFDVFWMHFNLPNLDCHYVCSDNQLYKNGRGAFFCESRYPDALKENACMIKKIAESNGFNINDLMVVDNCDCPNIPVQYKSNCNTPSITEYFKNSNC